MKKLLLISLSASAIYAHEATIIVAGMHCPLCTTAVKKAIAKVEGVKSVSARLNTKEVKVEYEEPASIAQILEAIETTSYKGEVVRAPLEQEF